MMSVNMIKTEDKIITKAFLLYAEIFGTSEINLENDYLKSIYNQIFKTLNNKGLECDFLTPSKGLEYEDSEHVYSVLQYYRFREKIISLIVGQGFGVLPKDFSPKIDLDYSDKLYEDLENSMTDEEKEIAKSVYEAVAIGTIDYDKTDEEEFELIFPSSKVKNR